MIDTFSIKHIYRKPPDFGLLEENCFKAKFHRFTGAPTGYFYNSKREPTIDVYQGKDYQRKEIYWIIKVEATPANWSKGSNLYLPTDSQISDFLNDLSHFVSCKTGTNFDAPKGVLTRVDFAKDFYVGTKNILPIITNFQSLDLPKYNTETYGKTSAYLTNRGKTRDKTIKIYSKEHKESSKSIDLLNLFASTGLIRLEVTLRDAKVRYLAHSFGLVNYEAKTILKNEISDRFLESVKREIDFEHRIRHPQSNLECLFDGKMGSYGLTLMGYRYAQKELGKDFHKSPLVNISSRTLRNYERDCSKAGVFSL